MGLLMGLEGVDWIQTVLREKFKELIEIEIPLPHRKMLVHFSVIIVEVDLNQIPSECFEPDGERGFGVRESVVMASVETKSKMG
jgi:hypothetical protein